MQRHFPGIAAAVLSAVLMATIGVISRKTGLPAQTITFFRLFLGALFMAAFLLATAQTTYLRRKSPWPVLLNGALLASFMIWYIQAMNFTTMANAILMTYLAPVAASVFAHVFFKERLSWLNAVCIGLALFGFVMVLEFRMDLAADGQHARGLGYALLAMCAYAAFILINRRIGPDVHPYTSTFYQLLTGAAVMMPFVFAQRLDFSGEQWLWLAGAGLFPGFLGILLAVVALKRLRASTFGTLAYFEPLAVMIFGAVFFGEWLSPLQMAGCAVIFGSGIATAFLGSKST